MTLNVDELDISDVEVGQTVTITADAVEDAVYTGVVTNVSVAGNTSGGITTYPVTIRIDETDGLRPGMNVDAEIVISSAEDVLAVPSGAVNRGSTVMIATDSPSAASAPDQEAPEGCVYVQVETGISADSYTQISKGEFVAIVGPGNGIQGCIEDSFANMGTDSLTVAVMGRGSSRSVSEEEMYQLVSDNQDMLKQLSPWSPCPSRCRSAASTSAAQWQKPPSPSGIMPPPEATRWRWMWHPASPTAEMNTQWGSWCRSCWTTR